MVIFCLRGLGMLMLAMYKDSLWESGDYVKWDTLDVCIDGGCVMWSVGCSPEPM